MDLMVVCAQAGLSMEASINRIAAELSIAYPSLARNLDITAREIRSGKSLASAIESLSKRLGIQEAALQFAAVLTAAPDPAAAFYLGVCYAESGRWADAAAVWRKALDNPSPLAIQYAALADVLLRAGDAEQAVVLLREASTLWREDDRLRFLLAVAHARQAQYQETLADVEAYLDHHAEGPEALLLAAHALFAARAERQIIISDQEDRDRLARYVSLYVRTGGPHAALVAGWAPDEPAAGAR